MRKKSSFWSKPLLILALLSFVLTGCPPPVDPPVMPTLTTMSAGSITSTSATAGGNISIDGGADVTARGVCWGSTTGPTIANSKTSEGTGIGNFSSSLKGLNPGVTYYVRAYATNSAGTAYGNEVSFTTNIILSIITTTAITSITTSSAISGGNITSDGGGAITARGVCWSTTTGPSISGSKTSDNTGTGSFSSNITGLTANTTYYVRAYVTNSAGTAYGSEVSFKTSANPPTVLTTNVSSIGTTTATSGANVTFDGGASVTVRGVCWSTSTNPTTINSKTIDTGTTGIFTSSLTSLMAGTTYYLRAYATNSSGTGYGNEISFTTFAASGLIFNPNLTYGSLSDIDGNVYKTIQIGTQVWMAENLKTIRLNDGTAIPYVIGYAWYLLITPGYCWYNNDATTNKNTYGALYNWYTVNTGKLCPTGWHVPAEKEWDIMATTLGGQDITQGNVTHGKVKETGFSHWTSPNYYATNESGFTAVPGGSIDDREFSGKGFYAYWWSSTENEDPKYSAIYAWHRSADYGPGSFGVGSYENGFKWTGFSVRCLKN